MFLELIATFAAGFAAAGVVLLLNMITRGRLAKWAMPVAAGAAMIAVGIANEYSWGARTKASLPEGVVVLEDIRESAWWRPWSYISAPTVRILALDTGAVQTREQFPDLRLVDFYLFARWQPPAKAPQLVDCASAVQADATAAALADPTTAFWADADPRLLTEFCGS